MIKLIYIWVNSYREIINRQGYQLSPEILIQPKEISEKDAGELVVSLRLTDNRKNTVQNFYGDNIVSLTAFVGKNGSGKTTLSKMLLEYLHDGVQLNNSWDAVKAYNGVQDQWWDSRYFYVLYDDLQSEITVCSRVMKIKVENEIDGIKNVKVYQENGIESKVKSAVRYGIYLTNVFNPREMLKPFNKRSLEESVQKFQLFYSPAFLLKSAIEEQTKNLYGCHMNETSTHCMQEYAQSQANADFLPYLNKQAELFIESFYQMPESFKQELHIYQEFGLDVVPPGGIDEIQPYMDKDFRDYNEQFWKLDPQQQYMVRLKKSFWFPQTGESDILMNLYINMLLEVYGVFMNLPSDQKKDIEHIFPQEIAGISEETLENIRKCLQKETYKEKGWAKEILEFIDFIKDEEPVACKREWIGNPGIHKITEKKLLDWYYSEIKKRNSFVKRNLLFSWQASSSGEMAAANLFSYLHHAISKARTQDSDSGKSGGKQNVMVIFDELDCYLHPKWQQRIVKMILEKLRDYDDFNFQVVITSHSPIILSDICRENILKLENFNAQLSEERTFGADISMLYQDSFFMDEGDIGDFAKENIQYVVEQLNSERLDDEEKLLYIIENIGQDLVRQKLESRYLAVREKQPTDDPLNVVYMLNQMNTSDREKVKCFIEKLQKKHTEETADD